MPASSVNFPNKENIHNLSTYFMYTLPKFLTLLLNLYFNLLLIHPSLQEINGIATANLGNLSMETPEHITTEVKINHLLKDYKRTLEELSTIEDDAQTISEMQKARKIFMERAQTIEKELQAETTTLSPKEVSLLKEKQLLNPVFKQINDASWAFMRTGRLENNSELKNAFSAMDDFMEVIFK